MPQQQGILAGTVINCWNKPEVVAIELTHLGLYVGDSIFVVTTRPQARSRTSFTQTIGDMKIAGTQQPVNAAPTGYKITIRLDKGKRARKGDSVYLIRTIG